MVLPARPHAANSLTIYNSAAPIYGLKVGLWWWIPGMIWRAATRFSATGGLPGESIPNELRPGSDILAGVTPRKEKPAFPQPVKNGAEIRAHLDQILGSSAFRGSKRCQDFLQYAVDRAIEGDKESLKERSLAVEVFGRGSSADLGDDSVVRVGAREVRKRLAQYYATDGAADALRIDLPAGSYVPTFQCPQNPAPPAPPAQPPAPPPAAAPPVAKAAAPAPRPAPAATPAPPAPTAKPALPRPAAPSVTPPPPSAATAAPPVSAPKPAPPPVAAPPPPPPVVTPTPAYEPPPEPVVVPAAPILEESIPEPAPLTIEPPTPPARGTRRPPMWALIAALILLAVVAFILRRWTHNGSPDTGAFWKPAIDASGPVVIVTGNAAADNSVSLAETEAAVRIGAIFAGPGHAVSVRTVGTVDAAELHASTAVLIGGAVGEISPTLPFRIATADGKASIVDPSGNDRWSGDDYALIGRLPHADSGSFTVVEAGLAQAGTEEAARILADPVALAVLLKQLPAGWESRNVALVVRSKSGGTPRLIAHREW